MKKLTDEWKIRKMTKSFRDSIDFDFPSTTKDDRIPKNRLSSNFQKKVFISNSTCANLDTSRNGTLKDSSLPPRRSCRLKEKYISVKHTGMKDQNYQVKDNNKENLVLNSPSNRLDSKMKFHVDAKRENFSVDANCNESKNPNLQIKELSEESHNQKSGILLKNSSLHHTSCSGDESRSVTTEDCYDFEYWGLPGRVISAYQARGINKMFHWQFECLSMKDVLSGKNLVYSAPTSAGKTLVAEILMLKKVLETKKKAMMILPFVSVVREKVNYLQEIFQDTGIVVDGYMGAHRPPGGFKAVDVAICTIEKANNLVNRLMEEKQLNELGILVVDELHMLGDNSRGYLLELLLTKLLYNCKKNDISIQIIGMSATLPNLNILAFWLSSELYYTDFRPVPLHEMYKIGSTIFDSKTSNPLRNLAKDVISFAKDSDHTIFLTIETVSSGNGVLIFCPSKNWCETLATSIAHEIYNVGRPTQEHKNIRYEQIGEKLREYINGTALSHILLQLKNSPAGLDPVLKLTVPFGVAFHHAGLTFDERDIIESAFRQGILKVLVATSTLSSGVNLPARRVLIRSPLFCGSVIDTLSYKQMVGRAGRKGIDDQGESILLCKESERNSALQLVNSELKPVKSCLLKSGKSGLHASLKRAVIEVIASGAATTHTEVVQYVSCTLLFASLIHENSTGEVSNNNIETSINKCLDYLQENDFIFKIEEEKNDSVHVSYKPSQLGIAILASGFSPEDALRILKELQLARRCFVLENDLHILYEVTPPYLSDQMGSLNWMTFLSIWEQLPDDFRRVGELVGVSESFIGLGVQGRIHMNAAQTHKRLAIHQRFYASLALNDLIQEVPLTVVSEKYNCNKGILQSLQQTTSTFSGMLTIFCNRLGWYNLELLFSHFQKRVHFGIQQELCDLVQLTTLNAQRARVLYNAGFETVSSLASADPGELELVLCNAGAFESEKQLDGDIAQEALQRREVKRIRITGKQGVNEREAAILVIKEAQNFIKYELGIKTISWQSPADKVSTNIPESTEKKDIKVDPTDVSQNMQHTNYSHITGSNINYESNPNLSSAKSHKCTKSPEKNIKLSFENNNQTSDAVDWNSNKDKSNFKFNETKQELNKNCLKACTSIKDCVLKSNNIEAGTSNINVNGTINSNVTESVVSDFSHSQTPLSSQGKRIPTSRKCNTVKSNINEPIVSSHVASLENTPKSSSSIQDSLGKIDKSEEVYSNSSMILQVNNIFKSMCEKNESYFCLEDVDELFNELEQTVQEIHEEKPLNCVSDGGGNISLKNDLTFSQLLLSQTAETENIYLAEPLVKSNFQDSSFSELLDEFPCTEKSCLSNSRMENIQGQFASKETRDVFDAIFDSPPSFSMVFDKKSKVVTELETDTTVQKCSRKNPNRALAKDISGQFFPDIKRNSVSICKDHSFDLQLINQKVTSQSTPNIDLNKANCFEDAICDTFPSALIENSKFDFSELHIHGINIPKTVKRKSSSPVLNKNLKLETSGDIFESDSEPPDKLGYNVSESEKLEKSSNSDKNIHMFSSCSDEIFTTDKSFENLLENNCNRENDICSLKDVCSGNPSTDHKVCKLTQESADIKSYLQSKIQDQNFKFCHFSPTTIKQVALENSGDIFDAYSEHDPVSNDAKKQPSFIFEEHSEMFRSWNPSPNNVIQPETSQKRTPLKENSPFVDTNLKNRNNDSFIANASAFSSFSSECLEPTPPGKSHVNTVKTLPLHPSVSLKSSLLNMNVAEDKVKCRLFEDTKTNQVNDMRSMFHDKIVKEKISLPGVIGLNIVDVSDDKFDSFLTSLKKTPIFSLSVACEKVEKKSVSIGPPNLRGKKSSVANQKICIDGDILIVGLSFCWGANVFIINFQNGSSDGTHCNQFANLECKLKLLQKLFHDSANKKIVAYDIKSICKMLWKGCDISLPQNKEVSYLDPSIASWLLDPSDGQQNLQELVLNYYPDASHLIEGFDRSHGSLGLQHWSSIPGRQRASTEAYLSFHLINILLDLLSDKQLLKSFVNVEMPSVLSLAEMEQNGLGFDLKLAMKYRKELQKKQDSLLKKAHQLAGRGFNIMSSRDLAKILYKELKLNPPNENCSPAASKHLALGILTRSGRKKLPPELKTNRECLEKIMHLHPLPHTIINWRRLSFAVSKVLMPLLRENKFDNHFKMHRLYSTCFVYTVTGRVNMHTPNLQFIPRDFSVDGSSEDDEYCQVDDEISDYGVSLRDMFVPAEDHVLLSADYSQLELRILAHLSGDVKLLKSLNSGDDIFKQIASTWKNMPLICVDGELRQQAKKICYGIIYGMSSKSLSHQLRTTENDAAYFMETFKKSYPGVTNYLDSVIESCRNKGYVITLMGRRRYLPSILSDMRGERAHAERQAINTTIQGSAADIIKIAMIEIDNQLKVMYQNTGVKKGVHNPKIPGFRGGFLVLQLHDELMYEVSKKDLSKVKDIVKTVMEKTTKLSVKLPVNIRVGASWGSMKEVL